MGVRAFPRVFPTTPSIFHVIGFPGQKIKTSSKVQSAFVGLGDKPSKRKEASDAKGRICYNAAMYEWALILTLGGTPAEPDTTLRGFSSRAECAEAAREFVRTHPLYEFWPEDRKFLMDHAVLKPTARCVDTSKSLKTNPPSSGK